MVKNWYKEAIIYGIDIKLFQDSSNNGFGDFKGLTSRLDYLEELGVNCLWLMPFYPSPLKDYGYDVEDFLGIDPRLGSMDDFLNFMEVCQNKKIRVIIDLVINHTSINHPWFVQAKVDRDSPYRDYYVWKDQKPQDEERQVMFEGEEESIWEYRAESNSYYLHTYFQEQADLNIANPKVRKEIFKIIKFWLNLGVSGFRIDAAHALTDPYPNSQSAIEALYDFLKEIRDFSLAINPEAVLVGEADVPSKKIQEYFGEGDRIAMLFNFFSNQYCFLALATQSALPLQKALKISKKITCGHFLNFIRHHDELNLVQLTQKERKTVLDKFAPDKKMRVFKDGGIKRELPSILKNDISHIKLAYMTIFSLPGSPMLHYGEEIGMGDDIERKMRFSVRIPMQWSAQQHGGFSSAPLESLYCAPMAYGEFKYSQVNVEKQKKDPESLLGFMQQLIKKRKECKEIGLGEWDYIDVKNEKLLVILYEWEKQKLLTICNFSPKKEVGVLPDFLYEKNSFVDVLSDRKYSKDLKKLTINGFGYRWIRFNHLKII